MSRWSQRVREDTPRTVLFAVGVLVAIGLIGSALVGLVGLLVTPASAPAAAASPSPTPTASTAAWTQTPAERVLTATLTAPPSGWTRNGDLGRGVGAPAPYSCPGDGTTSATSLGATYTVDGKPVTVTAQAFTAGQGARVQDALASAAGSCAGGADQQDLGDSGPGLSPRLATSSRAGVDTAVASWRRGDVIVYLAGTPDQDVARYARDLDGVLGSRLGDTCVAQDSTAADATRSPVRSGYTPYTVASTVRIADLATPQPTAGASAYPLPAPSLIDRAATPTGPRDYPVWPRMPDPVAEPTLPEAPASSPPTSLDVRVPAADTTGPGCGWAFTGMKAPAADAAAIAAARTKAEDAGRARLQADARSWQNSVTAYWKAYAAYEKAVPGYLSYRDKVDAVNAAWAVIDGQWAQYRSDYAAYQNAVAARSDFLARKAAAQSDYDAAVKRCEAPDPEPSKKPSPSPSSSPSPSPSPSKKPSAPPSDPPKKTKDEAEKASSSGSLVITTAVQPAAKKGCPADRPDILDQEAPSVPTPPSPPADPRPVSER